MNWMIGGRRLAFGMAALALGLVAAGPAAAGPNTGKLSLSGGIDFTTAYFFRGILQERDGLIVQPYLEVGANLYSAPEDYDVSRDGPLSSISLTLGTWNSLQSKQTGGTDENDPVFYETDWYGGVNFGFFGKLDTGVSYVAYTSPSDAFSTVQEVDFNLGLDDSEWLGAWALSPSATFAIETDGAALGKSGSYAQIGIEPSFEAIHSDTYPVNVSFPVTAGFSINNYYDGPGKNDQTWGFADFGVVASVPLAFIPEDYGSWSFSGGAHLFTFNKGLQKINHDNDPWVVGVWSLSMTY